MTVLSLFDGMSCGRVALERAGVRIDKYFASEIDPYATRISEKNYPDIIRLGDVRTVDFLSLPPIDLLIGGSPCQDLSKANPNAKGLDGDKSGLFFKYVEALRTLKPRYFLLENVVPGNPGWSETMDQEIGVEHRAINSDRFVQQNRVRLYWTNIPIAPLPKRPDWDGVFYKYRSRTFKKMKNGTCPCLLSNMGKGRANVPLRAPDLSATLSAEDCEELQGLQRGYTSGVSSSQRYKIIGNGWTVDVIAHIFKGMIT